MLEPIPISVLSHEVILKSYYDNLGNISYLEDEIIKNVRVQFDKKTNYIDGAHVTTVENILFVDVVNSKYTNINLFTIESIIIFKGREFRITSIEFIDGFDELHHLEMTLV